MSRELLDSKANYWALVQERVGAAVQPSAVTEPASPPHLRNRSWFSREMCVVWAALLVYAIGFLIFYPQALTNFDEVCYVRQAVSFASGSATVDTVDPVTGQHQRIHPSDYPAGTSILMTPFAWVAGWRGTFLLGLLALMAATLLTARWIADSGGSPIFALVVLGYLPALVLARTGMSDVPSACFVAAGLWLFWRGDQGGPWRRLAAGFLAGASVCLREPNPLLFAIFFAGALIRWERNLVPLILGGLAGVACRPLTSELVYGTPFFVKDYFYGFSGLFAGENAIMYFTALLVLVPGGLIFVLFYRGKRWIELIATVLAYVGLFIAYNYNGAASGGLKQWMLSLRFLIPTMPIVAFAMAHTCSRWYHALIERASLPNRSTLQRTATGAVALWVAGIAVVGLMVNWRSRGWSELHEQVVKTVYANTDPALPIMADLPATVKFLNELNGQRMLLDVDLGDANNQLRRYQILRLLDRSKTIQVVLFGRDDSDYWLNKSNDDQAFIAAMSQQLHATLKLQQRFPGLGVLRIWNVSDPS